MHMLHKGGEAVKYTYVQIQVTRYLQSLNKCDYNFRTLPTSKIQLEATSRIDTLLLSIYLDGFHSKRQTDRPLSPPRRANPQIKLLRTRTQLPTCFNGSMKRDLV
jgi:hypothetical protein